MKKVFIALLFLLSISFSQTILTESFDNFIPNKLQSTVLLVVYDSQYHSDLATGKEIYQDLSDSLNNLTPIRFQTNFDTSLVSGSKLYRGGDILHFDNPSGQYMYRNNDPDFNFGTGDRSLTAVVKPNDLNRNRGIISKLGLASTGYYLLINNLEQVRFILKDNSTNFDYTWTNQSLSTTEFSIINVNVDFDGNITLYINGLQVGTPQASSPTLTTDNTEELRIGSNYFGLPPYSNFGFWDGYIEVVRVDRALLSEKQIKEDAFLVNGWYSKNGGVYRNNWGWYQGIIGDTVYTTIPNSTVTANRQAVLSFDAWGQNGGEVIKPYTLNWDGGQSITVTNQKKKYTVYFGQMDFSSDSLYFAVPAAADTVYIDNVLLKYDKVITSKKWPGWNVQ